MLLSPRMSFRCYGTLQWAKAKYFFLKLAVYSVEYIFLFTSQLADHWKNTYYRYMLTANFSLYRTWCWLSSPSKCVNFSFTSFILPFHSWSVGVFFLNFRGTWDTNRDGSNSNQIHGKAKVLNYTKAKLFNFILNHISIKNNHCERITVDLTWQLLAFLVYNMNFIWVLQTY